MSARSLDRAIELPAADPAIAALDPATRHAIARTWLEHASSELGAARAFCAIAELTLLRACPADVRWLAARAVSDEVRHAEIARRVALSYGAPTTAIEPRAVAAADGSRLAIAIAQCCVQETLAAAYLERAHASASAPLARAALRELLADEIDHGRIGWALAASLDPRERAAVRAELPPLVDACTATWRARAAALPDVAAPEHGVLRPDAIVTLVDEAMRDLVQPGLRTVALA